jgi:hypothetical protein
MTPVKQTKLYGKDGIHNGNCYAACLASLLDLPLWMVPPFEDMFGRGGEYHKRTQEWLGRMFGLQLEDTDDLCSAELPEFYMASGPGARGVHHAVIYSGGKLVHDPHPSGDGILSVEWCWYLKPVEPAP